MILFSSEIFVVLLLWLRHLLVTLLTAIVLKRAPGPHAVRRDAPVVIGTITFAISRYFIFFFFFFLQWAILMPDICIPIALILAL